MTLARHLPCSILLALGLGLGVTLVGCPGERAPPRRIDQLLDDPKQHREGPSGEGHPSNDGSQGGDHAPDGGDPVAGD